MAYFYFYVIFVLLFLNFSVGASSDNILAQNRITQKTYARLYPDISDTITCRLSSIARVSFINGNIQNEAHIERAKSTSVFTGLTTDKPKMLKPDKIDLIKVRQHNGIYWLVSPLGNTGLVTFTIDTNKKVMIQQRSADMLGRVFYGHSWIGKCE